jgi:hypothetical protein
MSKQKLTEQQAQEILDDFIEITETHVINGGALRGEPNATVAPSGRAILNTEATIKWYALVHQYDLNPNQCSVTFKASRTSGRVACYPSPEDAKGCMPVRSQGDFAVLHLGGVFKQVADLRPTGTRECVVKFEPDKKGRDCMMISVANGAVKTGRRSSSSSSESQTAKSAKSSTAQPKTETQ